MGWFQLFTPPEWGLWTWRERLIYVVGLCLFLFLLGRGALSLAYFVPPLF